MEGDPGKHPDQREEDVEAYRKSSDQATVAEEALDLMNERELGSKIGIGCG
jgi:hypothetical protein